MPATVRRYTLSLAGQDVPAVEQHAVDWPGEQVTEGQLLGPGAP